MALTLNQEQQMLRDSAQAFLAESAPVAHLRALRDSRDEQGFSRELWASFGEMGFAGVMIPEAHGGVGLGVLEAGQIAEQLGHTLTPSPFLSSAVLAANALVRGGTSAQQAKWLPAIASGHAVAALAIDEHSKHRPAAISTTARAQGSGFLLDGEKCFVVDGHVADLLIVAAHVQGNPTEGPSDATGTAARITLFLVDPKAAGVSIERSLQVDSHNAARVRLAGVQLQADAVLGGADAIGQGGALLEAVLDTGRAVLAAQLVGIADEVFERTQAYLKERKQFDRLIGEFQSLQHRMAALYTDIELARAITMRAFEALASSQQDDRTRAIVSAAKARACTSANLAVCEAVQMHGGMGMTDAFDIGLFMKRARVVQEWLGDANFHADRFARLSGY
ncbi:MAG: acyl-CoA dehydrogenase family protein [Quisquiliibacterium sp.]